MQKISEIMFDLLELHKVNYKEKTYQTYKSKLNIFEDWLNENNLNEMDIKDFDLDLAQRFINSLQRHTKTRHSYRTLLKEYFGILVDKEEIAKNPFKKVRLPRLITTENKRAFTSQEQKTIKDYCQKYEYQELWFFIECMFYTLARPNELRLLKISEIDFDNGYIMIRAENAKNKQNQYIQIPDSFLPKLREATENKPKSFYLFGGLNARGKNFYNRHLKIVLSNVGIVSKDVSLYSWKHTGAKAYYLATKDIHGLMKQCRHSGLDMTERYLKTLLRVSNDNIKNNYPML